MDADLAALSETAATRLVEQLMSEGWALAQAAVGALWRRVHPERAAVVEAELAETRDAAVEARRCGDTNAQQDLVDEWQSRLRRLVATDPDLAADLRSLVADWSRPGTDSGSAGQVDLRIHASGHSRVTAAGRDIYVTESA